MRKNRDVLCSWAVAFAAAVIVLQPLIQAGAADPIFSTVPFETWFEGTGQTRFRWTERVVPPELSVHQRLLAQVEVRLDGAELARRRGKGELLILCQFTDGHGTKWQDHGTVDLAKINAGMRGNDVSFVESAFVLPGEYSVSLALFDTATGEHAVRRDHLHVAPLASDPLPHAWQGLPPIEFVAPAEAPDAWFLPYISGRLHVRLGGRPTLRLDVILNLTPSERVSGSLRVRDRNLGALIPALKVISQIDMPGVPFGVSLLDLTRRRVAFEQEDAHELDWPKMSESLSENNPGSVDVKALENRQHNARFFVAEVSRRLGPSRALIILSSPVAFEGGQDLQPIQMQPPPGCQVFYVRYQPLRTAGPLAVGRQAPGPIHPGWNPGAGVRPGMPPLTDQLAATLKPLAPRLFDVHTPDQFRRALGSILAELAEK